MKIEIDEVTEKFIQCFIKIQTSLDDPELPGSKRAGLLEKRRRISFRLSNAIAVDYEATYISDLRAASTGSTINGRQAQACNRKEPPQT